MSPQTTPESSGRNGAYLALLLMIVVWGCNWPIMKIGLEDIGPLLFAFIRFVSGAVCLFAVLAFRKRLRLPGRADLPVMLSVGLGHMGLFLTLVNIALLYVPAGRSAILSYTTPLWVVPMAVLFLGERLTWRKLLGLAAGLGGLMVLFNPAGFDWSDPDTVTGNGLLLLAALIWAGVIVHVRGHSWSLSPLQLAPWQLLTGAVPVGLLALFFEHDATVTWSPSLIAVLLYNGPLASAFAFWASVHVSRTLPSISASIGFLGVPVVGYLAAAVLLGEAITLTTGGGLALIIAGVAFVLLSDRTNSRKSG